MRAGAVLRRASLSRRGVGAWPASRRPRVSGGTGKRSREARTSERAPGLGEPAPSVGFKRPLSAPRAALSGLSV